MFFYSPAVLSVAYHSFRAFQGLPISINDQIYLAVIYVSRAVDISARYNLSE